MPVSALIDSLRLWQNCVPLSCETVHTSVPVQYLLPEDFRHGCNLQGAKSVTGLIVSGQDGPDGLVYRKIVLPAFADSRRSVGVRDCV